MRRALLPVSLVAVASAIGASGAPAKPTAAQDLFRERLLEDRSVARDVKTRLRKGGFVDRRVLFADLTGEGRSDAVVLVHSGGSAGRIALFVLSAGDGSRLEVVYRNQRLHRATAAISRRSGRLVYRVPAHRPGDELCCPSAVRDTELRWDARRERFRVADRRTIELDDGAGAALR